MVLIYKMSNNPWIRRTVPKGTKKKRRGEFQPFATKRAYDR